MVKRLKLTLILTALFSLALAFSSPAKAQVCRDVFTKSGAFSVPSVYKSTREFFLALEGPRAREDWDGRWSDPAHEIISEFADPYSLAYDVRAVTEKRGGALGHEVATLLLALGEFSATKRADRLNSWVTSDAHALFLYDYLSTQKFKGYEKDLASLKESNPFFAKTHANPESPALLTYAFEKEGTKSVVTELYRAPGVTDDVWFKMSEDERMNALKALDIPYRSFVAADKVAPTSLKPLFLSGYSVEVEDAQHKGYGWELSHKKYEINLDRVLAQIRETAEIFGETHSIHAHTVFEIEDKKSQIKSFKIWFKALNDKLYLQGMEEGLHGNSLTGIVSTSALKFNSFSDINYGEYKFFSAGLRGDAYGKASKKKYSKLGIELRDTTRNLDVLNKSMRDLTESLSTGAWSRIVDKKIPKKMTQVTLSSAKSYLRLERTGLSPKTAIYLTVVEPSVSLPLIEYEVGDIFNYKTGEFEQADAEYTERIVAARAAYVHSLLMLEKEIREIKKRGEKLNKIEVAMAIKMNMSTWAKAARPSTRFNF